MSVTVGCPKCGNSEASGMIREDGKIVCNRCYQVIGEV